jgi:hypothetical protein
VDTTQNSTKWWEKWGRRPPPSPNPDAIVTMWKTAWVEGATAAWTPNSSATNPYAGGAQQAAWSAGWEWAQRNPDRRHTDPSRLAHPHRRATDSPIPVYVKGAVGLGVAGVTVYAISKALRRWGRRASSDLPPKAS